MSRPKNQMLNLTGIPGDIERSCIIPFLDLPSFYALSFTCKHFQYGCINADKKVAAKMLHCVLNPTRDNQKRFQKLLSTPKQDSKGLPLYLIRNNGREVYRNKEGVEKTKTTRCNTNVLEAILRTGNFHLAKVLFKSIPEKENTKSLQQYIKEIKALGIWGMPEIQTAYDDFKSFHDRVFDFNGEDSEKLGCWVRESVSIWSVFPNRESLGKLDRLSSRIGQALKEHLPWFSIYLFFNPNPYYKVDYTQAPSWTCILLDGTELDLDLLDASSPCALMHYEGGVILSPVGGWDGRSMPLGDMLSFKRQCEQLSPALDNTIEQFITGDYERENSRCLVS